MKTEELEVKLKGLATTVDKLAAKLQIAEDIESIKKLQRAYGYYLEHWQADEIVELWSHNNDVSLEINDSGLYKGYEAVKQSFQFENHYTAFNGARTAPPEYLHILIPVAGIVDLDPDGKTAKGRWYGTFLGALPRGGILRALIGCGIWENEYVKEHGIWKFKKLFFNDIISSPLDEGWVKTPYISNPPAKNRPAPGRNTHFQHYPSGYIFPYHYKNPVTGK
jgi:SnoaL-like domain